VQNIHLAFEKFSFSHGFREFSWMNEISAFYSFIFQTKTFLFIGLTMQVLCTDHLLHHVGLVLRHVTTGTTLLAHVDRLNEDDISAMMTRLIRDSTGCDDRWVQYWFLFSFTYWSKFWRQFF
jgi:hypothetical protein